MTVSEYEVVPRPAMIYAPILAALDVVDELAELAYVEQPEVV